MSGQVTSHTSCMPCFQEKSVMPSGLFESSWHKPVGSGAEVCLAAPMALSKMSFILSCLGLEPLALVQESPCLAVV